MKFLTRNYVSPVSFVCVCFFLYVSVFGLNTVVISVTGLNEIVNCPLMRGHSEALCKLNPIEHIKEWQDMFTSLSAREFILIFVISILLVIFKKLTLRSQRGLFDSISFFSHNRHVLLRSIPNSTLHEAYSNGVLNSKVF